MPFPVVPPAPVAPTRRVAGRPGAGNHTSASPEGGVLAATSSDVRTAGTDGVSAGAGSASAEAKEQPDDAEALKQLLDAQYDAAVLHYAVETANHKAALIILANVKLDIGQETRQENERKDARTKRMWMARPAQTKNKPVRAASLCASFHSQRRSCSSPGHAIAASLRQEHLRAVCGPRREGTGP